MTRKELVEALVGAWKTREAKLKLARETKAHTKSFMQLVKLPPVTKKKKLKGNN